MKSLDIFNTIILLGALQGFITSGLLFLSKKNSRANRFLSSLIFLIALASINLYGNYVNWFNLKTLQFLAQLIPLVIIMPLGPLLYFYVRLFADPNFKLGKELKYHFYPSLIDFVPTLVILFYFFGINTGLIKNNPEPWGIFIDNFNVYADIPRWLSLSIYVYLASKYLAQLSTESHTISKNHLNWLKLFIKVFICFQVVWLIYLIPYVMPAYSNKLLDALGWYPVYVPLVILIYWLGIKGYIVSHTEHLILKRNTAIKDLLSPEEVEAISISLSHAMEVKKLYLDPQINLNALAKHLGYSPKIISAVLNHHFQKSFNDYINEYRIAEFKTKFLGSEFEHLTITGIALECGFNSQATFQRAFKELMGVSPSQFRKTMTI